MLPAIQGALGAQMHAYPTPPVDAGKHDTASQVAIYTYEAAFAAVRANNPERLYA